MNSEMRSPSTVTSSSSSSSSTATTIPFVPWENNGSSSSSPPQQQQHNTNNHHPSSMTSPSQQQQQQQLHMIGQDREYRRRLAGAIRTVLHRQNRAYFRHIHQLEAQWRQQMHHQQQQQLRHHYHCATTNAPSGFMENESVIRLTVDVPGVNKDDVQVQILPMTSSLPILQHHGPHEQQQYNYELRVTAKRSYLSMDGTSCMSTNTKLQRYSINHHVVDITQTTATLHHGVLTVTAPKKKKETPNKNNNEMETAKDHSTSVTQSSNEGGIRVNEIINVKVSEE